MARERPTPKATVTRNHTPVQSRFLGTVDKLLFKRGKGMIFLRCAFHCASTVTLLLCLDASALAQSSRSAGINEETAAAAKRQEETNNQLKAIAAEIKAIREQQLTTEQRESAYEAEQRNSAYWPPEWSNWVLAVFAAVAAIISAITFRALKEQVSANVAAAQATADAVQASRDSITQTERHFELLNAQWLEVGRFSVEPLTFPQDGKMNWVVRFRISNRTQLVVTIERIEFYLDRDVTIVHQTNQIGPSSDQKEEIVATAVSSGKKADIETGKATDAMLVGRIHYMNAVGNRLTREFGTWGMVTSPKRTRLTYETPSLPRHLARMDKLIAGKLNYEDLDDTTET